MTRKPHVSSLVDMCNLYRLTKPNFELAHLFDVIQGQVGNVGMSEVYPGRSGLVVAKGELRSMTWGFAPT